MTQMGDFTWLEVSGLTLRYGDRTVKNFKTLVSLIPKRSFPEQGRKKI